MRLAKQKLPMCGRIAKKSKSEDARTTAKDELEKRVTLLKDAAPNQLVVAALVATVSFTAGFTIPGGFNQNPGPDIGTAVFTKKSAFKAFLICDALAFTLSSLAVLQYFRAASAILVSKRHSSSYLRSSSSSMLEVSLQLLYSRLWSIIEAVPDLAFLLW